MDNFKVPVKEQVNGSARGASGKNNCLNSPQAFKLANWILSMKDELVRTRPRLDQVASAASKALGFTISVANVDRACKMADVKWILPRRKSSGNRVRNKMRVLASAIAALYTKLGEQAPADFVELMQELTS